jgi:hypothetical protein
VVPLFFFVPFSYFFFSFLYKAVVVEDLLTDYLKFLAREGESVSDGVKITVDDVGFVVRKDKKKHDRVRELVLKAKQIEQDKKQFKGPPGM